MEINEEQTKYRQLSGPVYYLWKSLLIAITLLGIIYILSIYQYFSITFMKEQYIGAFLALILASVYLGVPAGRKASRIKVPWYDWILSVLGAVIGLYVAVNYPVIVDTFGVVTPLRVILAILAMALILEALRRFIGWSLVSVVLVFLVYAYLAPHMPGAFKGQETPADLLFIYLYLDTNSLLNLLGLAATIGLAFILFGQALIQFKGGEIFNNLSIRLFGKFRGGPAKASITGSGMVGSITGDPVSNIVLTGSVTIPLMIKSGYARAHAGAIEAVASVGGIFAPPVMGIVAFMIAENLGIPYKEVAIAAIVPAILYFFCLFVQVDLLAAKNKIGKVSNEQMPSLAYVIKTSWLLIPIFGTLFYFLFFKGYPPQTAGIYAAGAAIIILLLQKEVRTNIINRIINTFQETGKILMELAVILSAAGFMVGIFGITGLGFNLSMALADFSQHGVFILLIACAIVCIILGMGLPGIAAYAIVAALVIPSLVDLGINPLAAHFFVFYFSMVSNFTPPMAVASFTASSLARVGPNQVAFNAMKLGGMAYIIPFLIVYNPALMLNGITDAGSFGTITSLVLLVYGCIVFSISIVGYSFGQHHFVLRVLLFATALIMLFPIELGKNVWMADLIGIIISLSILISKWVRAKKSILNIGNPSETI